MKTLHFEGINVMRKERNKIQIEIRNNTAERENVVFLETLTALSLSVFLVSGSFMVEANSWSPL